MAGLVNVPTVLGDIVMSCLRQVPAERFEDFKSLGEELQSFYFRATGQRVPITDYPQLPWGGLTSACRSLATLGAAQKSRRFACLRGKK